MNNFIKLLCTTIIINTYDETNEKLSWIIMMNNYNGQLWWIFMINNINYYND